MSDKYSADDIVRDINEGKTDDAKAHLNYDYLHMSPTEFKQLVKDMEDKTKADDGFFSSGGNNVYSETDKDGNITAVHIDDGVLWDTKLFDKKDYQGNPLGAFGALTRVIPGALDQGKKRK